MVKDIVHPIIDETTRALKRPMSVSRATSTERGAPPMSFAKREEGMIEGSR